MNNIGYFLTAFVLLFFFFAFVIWLKEAFIRNGLKEHPIAKLIFYPIAFAFLACDVAFNIIYGSIMFLQLPNSMGEGWTLTSRLRANIKRGKARMIRYDEPGLRFAIAVVLCQRFIETIDSNHCGLRY